MLGVFKEYREPELYILVRNWVVIGTYSSDKVIKGYSKGCPTWWMSHNQGIFYSKVGIFKNTPSRGLELVEYQAIGPRTTAITDAAKV